jgi:hypothetical protein
VTGGRGRRFHIGMALIVPVGLAVAGCGAASIPAPTTTLPAGTRVGPQQFLADSAATAQAIRTFAEDLGANGPSLTRAQAKASAPLLAAALAQAELGVQRLTAEQVDDSRLDAQRKAVLAPLGTAVVQMTAITAAAHAGNPGAVVAHLAPLRAAIAGVTQAGV